MGIFLVNLKIYLIQIPNSPLLPKFNSKNNNFIQQIAKDYIEALNALKKLQKFSSKTGTPLSDPSKIKKISRIDRLNNRFT